jgi:MFS family permease
MILANGRLGVDSPWLDKKFVRLFLSRTISTTGSAVAPIALAFAVLDLTHSPFDLSLVLAAQIVPEVLLLLIGGVFGDRYSRSRLMVMSNLIAFASELLIAIDLFTKRATLSELIVLSIFNGAAVALYTPASSGIVAEIVSTNRQHVNAVLRIGSNSARLGGAALGGVVVGLTSPATAIFYDSLTFLVSATLLVGIPLGNVKSGRSIGMLTEMREGWSEFRSRTWLWSMVLQAMFVNVALMGGFFLLGPVISKQHFGGPAAWGALVASFSGGYIAGGFVSLKWRPRRALIWSIVCITATAPLLLALAMPLHPWIVCCFAIVAGVGLEIYSIQWQTVIQDEIPIESLSRVSSFDALGSYAFIPIGYLVAGSLASSIGVRATLIWMAAVVFSSGLIVAGIPSIRKFQKNDAAVVT